MNTPVLKPRGLCKDCKFFEPDPSLARGTCHRYPPTLTHFIIPAVDSSGKQMLNINTSTNFPIVVPVHWCGEFILNLLEAKMN